MKPLLQTPGVAGPFASSLIGRIPVTAIGLLLVLHVEDLTGRFAVAGASAACFSLGLSVSAPVFGRLIDRRGQVTVVLAGAAVVTVALSAIAFLPAGAPAGAIAALAAVAGVAVPPLGSCLRALWVDAIDADRRHAAFAIDSAATELTYFIGPVVLAGAIGGWSTRTAIATSAAMFAIGGVAYTSRPAVRAWRPGERHPSLLGPLSAPAVRSLLGMLAFTGLCFGAVEVGVAAVAERAGVEGAAGPLLGAWAVGSIVGAIVTARAGAPRDPARRVVALLALLALAHVPLVATGEPLLLAPLLVLAGGSIAPALSTIFAVLGYAAPPGTVTEAFTWATTAIGGGIAAGAALGGAVAEAGHAAPFALAAGAGLTSACFAVLWRPVVAAGAQAQTMETADVA
ncbi:MAG TPA: MFS transporter [Capillimicrobium sp.]|nr:MFS transporter [Capillimicrobium sp.]